MPRHSLLPVAARTAFSQSCWPKPQSSMPSVNTFARDLAAESGVAVGDGKKVFVALSDIVAREVSGTACLKTHRRAHRPPQRVPNLSPSTLLSISGGPVPYKVAAKGSFQLPSLVAVHAKVKKARAGEAKGAVGKVIEVLPKPETKAVKFRVLKKLRNKVLG